MNSWLTSLPISLWIKSIKSDKLTENPVYQPTGKSIPSLTKFTPFTQTEVRKIIFSMKTRSCKFDTLPTKLLKECIDNILPTITSLVNISVRDDVFASRWKTSIIMPPKNSTLALICSSYHPVSNLSFSSKLFEKCAMDSVNEHFNLYKLLPDYQSAYHNDYSCETGIVKLNGQHWTVENQ